jgi:hypothetical protein
MATLALRFGPYAAIAVLALLLYAARAHINELDARIEQQRAEFIAQAADEVADAARVALRELDRAVAEERQRWQDLVAASNEAAISAEREREAAAARAEGLQATINDIYARDTDASAWRDTDLPAAIRDSLRD